MKMVTKRDLWRAAEAGSAQPLQEHISRNEITDDNRGFVTPRLCALKNNKTTVAVQQWWKEEIKGGRELRGVSKRAVSWRIERGTKCVRRKLIWDQIPSKKGLGKERSSRVRTTIGMMKNREKHTQGTQDDTHIDIQTVRRLCRLFPTCLAELRGAPALAWHANHGLHFGTNAGAPLLVVSAYRAHRRVWLAAVRLLQVTHVAADACALGHVHPAWGAHLPVFHFGCKVTVSHRHWDLGGMRGQRRGEEQG